MESSSKKQRGQLIVELSVVLGFLSLILFLALRGGILIKKKFKHDFITPSSIPEFEVKFNKNVFFTNVKTLKEQGWEIERKIPVDRGWFMMKKNNQKLLIADKLGILI